MNIRVENLKTRKSRGGGSDRPSHAKTRQLREEEAKEREGGGARANGRERERGGRAKGRDREEKGVYEGENTHAHSRARSGAHT